MTRRTRPAILSARGCALGAALARGRDLCGRALILVLLLACCAGGCARARAKTASDTPPLDMPPPPPRIIEPTATDLPALVPLPVSQEPARRAPSRTTQPPRPGAPKPETPKPEAPAELQRPAEEAPRQTVLQTTPAGKEGEVERTIRAMLDRATADLNRIDYRRLNADAQTQYNTAKRFATQAEDALRVKNLVYARNLADKAATLAAQLAGR